MIALQNPEQELRFTRAAQAVPFWVLAAILVATAVTLIATTYYRDMSPSLWPVLLLLPAWLLAKLAFRMTRHAYLILTPLGLEIFPLIRPQQGMRVIYWQEIDAVEANPALTLMSLHFDAERTGGVHLSLRPIAKPQRELLIHALRERVSGGGDKK